MKASTAKVVCELPTTRHHRTGTPVVVVDKSTATLGMAYATFAAPSTDVPSMPSLINPENGVPATIDWPTMTCRQPVSWPSAFRPASSLWKYIGRYRPPWMSSSRVHCSLIGVPSAPQGLAVGKAFPLLSVAPLGRRGQRAPAATA